MALHFIGFKDDRYWNAVKIWGKPDFIHRTWDWRAKQELAPQTALSAADVAIFAVGDEFKEPKLQAFNDSVVM